MKKKTGLLSGFKSCSPPVFVTLALSGSEVSAVRVGVLAKQGFLHAKAPRATWPSEHGGATVTYQLQMQAEPLLMMSSRRFLFRLINAAACAGGCPHTYNVKAFTPTQAHKENPCRNKHTCSQRTYKYSCMPTYFYHHQVFLQPYNRSRPAVAVDPVPESPCARNTSSHCKY